MNTQLFMLRCKRHYYYFDGIMNLAVNPNCDIFSSFLIIMRLENKMKLSSKNKHIAKMLQA